MRDMKSVVLVIVLILLISVVGFLTYMISNGQDPLVLFNSRATDNNEGVDSDLLANAGDGSNDSIPDELSPTPTTSFTSTSPTITPINTTTLQPSITLLPETGGGTTSTPTPTPTEELLVAGISDYINPLIISGGILILLAMLL